MGSESYEIMSQHYELLSKNLDFLGVTMTKANHEVLCMYNHKHFIVEKPKNAAHYWYLVHTPRHLSGEIYMTF